MLLTKEVTMNLNYREAPIVMDALQGDSGRALAIHFAAGETPWEIPADADVLLQYCCADGTGGMFDSLPDGTCAYSVNGDTLTICLVSQLCAVAGCTKLQVTLFSGGAQISTFPVEIRVAPQIHADAASGEYINLLQWWLSRDIKGDTGDPGVYIGTEEPADPAIRVWIFPAGEAGHILKVRDEDGNWVDIPSIVGPQGEPGVPGEVTTAQLEAHTGDSEVHVSAEEKDVWNGKQDALTDYVTEQGTSGVWTYRKWAGGAAECWCRYSTTVDLTNQMAGVYYCNTQGLAYPFVFSARPNVWVGGGATSTVNWAREFASDQNVAGFVVIANEQQTGISVDLCIYAKGNWK